MATEASFSFTWPYGSSGGIYNILFGGAAALGGLVLLSVATSLALRRGLQASSYFGFAVGLYLIVDAYSILHHSTDAVKITKEPLLSALFYLAPAAALILSVPVTHIKSRWARWVLAIFAVLFTVAWLYFAYTVTSEHLKPA